MWDKLNLPILLFKVGLLTLISFPGISGRQAGTHLPSREGSTLLASQAGAHLPLREGSSLVAPPNSQAGTLLPSGEGSNLAASQAAR